MQRIPIAVPPRPYEALIEPGLLSRAGELLAPLAPVSGRVFVLTVSPVRKRWGGALSRSLRKADLGDIRLEMKDGERHKTLATVEALAEQMVHRGGDRRSLLLALGGGVVGDVGGLLASLYMRGIEYVQIPTTFLAQVDAAIGGKTGVNLKAGKNLVGTFHQPRVVLIDPEVLSTLPEREYRAGLFEALKCGVIRNPTIFEFMERERTHILGRDAGALEWLIAECVKVKAAVVAADERESELRRILNFGHTIGHALEAATAYRTFLHGEAVAWGMMAAARMAVGTGRMDSGTAERLAVAIRSYGPLPAVRTSSRDILRRLAADKKAVEGAVHFVLPRAIGEVEVTPDVSTDIVRRAVGEVRQLSRQ